MLRIKYQAFYIFLSRLRTSQRWQRLFLLVSCSERNILLKTSVIIRVSRGFLLSPRNIEVQGKVVIYRGKETFSRQWELNELGERKIILIALCFAKSYLIPLE